jgi:hypothetical protein
MRCAPGARLPGEPTAVEAARTADDRDTRDLADDRAWYCEAATSGFTAAQLACSRRGRRGARSA